MPHRLQAEHSRLELDPADAIGALEAVLEQARTYLQGLDDAPVRKAESDEAARRARGPLPEEGDGTQETLRAPCSRSLTTRA
jgi:hypothetical protein